MGNLEDRLRETGDPNGFKSVEDHMVHQGVLIFNLLVKVTRKVDRDIEVCIEIDIPDEVSD